MMTLVDQKVLCEIQEQRKAKNLEDFIEMNFECIRSFCDDQKFLMLRAYFDSEINIFRSDSSVNGDYERILANGAEHEGIRLFGRGDQLTTNEICELSAMKIACAYTVQAENALKNNERDLAWAYLFDARYWVGMMIAGQRSTLDVHRAVSITRMNTPKREGAKGGNTKASKLSPLIELAYELVRTRMPKNGKWKSINFAANGIANDIFKEALKIDNEIIQKLDNNLNEKLKDLDLELHEKAKLETAIKSKKQCLNLSESSGVDTISRWLKKMPDKSELFN